MIIKDTFSKFTNISKLSGCIAFFTNEKSEITHLKKYLNSSDYKNLSVLLKNKNKKKALLSFDLNPNQKIIFISIKKNQKPNETEKSGAKLTDFLNNEGAEVIHIVSDTISLNLKPDDEVIVPDMTWVASAAPVIYVGAKPVLVDVDSNSWCITAKEIEKSISSKNNIIEIPLTSGIAIIKKKNGHYIGVADFRRDGTVFAK